MVEQVLLVTYTLVLPSDETSKYFISLKNRAKTKRFELWFVSGPTLKGRRQPNGENGQKSTRNCISFHTIRQCPRLYIFNLAFLPQARRDAGNHVDDQRSLRGILHHPGGDAWPPHPRGTCSPEVRPSAIFSTSLQISTRTPCAPRTCVDSCMRAVYESYMMR